MPNDETAIEGYMFWLVPASSDPACQALRSRVDHLAEQHRPSSGFQPHVTLLPTARGKELSHLVEAMRKALETWNGPVRLPVDLKQAQAGDIYFQAVIMPVDTRNANALLHLRRLAEDLADIHPPSYFPHLSLMYSQLAKAELEAIAKDASAGLPQSVDLAELWIVEGKGKVDTWKPVAKLRLDGTEIS